MSDVKIWDNINASPLLLLPPEQRQALHKAGDAQFRAFWADCFSAVQTLKLTRDSKQQNNELDSATFCEVFLRAFDNWKPKPGQKFGAYLTSAIKHEYVHECQQEDMVTTGFKRETNRKIKKALEYMTAHAVTEEMLCHDPEKEQMVADIVGVGVKTLHEALRNKRAVLSMDDADGESDTALSSRIASREKSVEEQAEQTGEMLVWLHRGIGLMDLQQKEKYGKTSGPLWSSVLMGYLRNNDTQEPTEDTPSRLANCDDLRPLEQDNCLWDVLLLHRYVEFTVQPPYEPKALECAALNVLLDADHNPAQDKTVAEFLGVSKAAVSQRRKTWQQKLLKMQAEQENT